MPNLKEAAVAVSGRVIDTERLTNYETKKPDGLRVVLATGDGFAQVKVPLENAQDLELPEMGVVNWMVRYGAYSQRNDNAQTTCRFLREIDLGDLDRLASAVNNKPAKG